MSTPYTDATGFMTASQHLAEAERFAMNAANETKIGGDPTKLDRFVRVSDLHRRLSMTVALVREPPASSVLGQVIKAVTE